MHSVDISEEVQKVREPAAEASQCCGEKEYKWPSSWLSKSKEAKVSRWQVQSNEWVRSLHTAGRVLAGNPRKVVSRRDFKRATLWLLY